MLVDLWPARWSLWLLGAAGSAAMLVHVAAGHAASGSSLWLLNIAVQWVTVEILRDALTSASAPVRVQVREADLSLAAEILADALSVPSRHATQSSLDRLGLSIRACAVSTFFAPLGLLLAPTYLLRARRSAVRPREHAWTLAGIAACVPASLFYAFDFRSLFLS